MNQLIVRSAALALVAALGSATAWANTPLFSVNGQAAGSPPSFGTSIGTVIVDDGTFTGSSPLNFDASVTSQLYLDIESISSLGAVIGSYATPLPVNTTAVSVFRYGFSVAATTTYSFAYNVLTNQVPGTVSDYFAAGIIGPGGTTTVAQVNNTGSYVLSSSGFGWESGVQFASFTLQPGNYNAEFVIGTTQLGCATGGLCIPTGVVIAGAIPEPETYAMFVAGLLALGAYIRRRRLG